MTNISNLKDAARRNQDLLRENRLLTQNLFKAQEEDSKYLAREIHDELGQWMTAILAEAEILSANNEQNTVNQASASAISKCVGKMHQVVHHLMGHLRPATLDILGLKDCLSELVSEWRSHHPKVTLDHLVEGDFEDVRDPINSTIYRIIQEAFNNISKYAHATRVTVRLTRNEDNTIGADHISLIIEDNGRGLSTTQKSDGMGLLGMRERALSLGGEFKLISSLGNGTRIEVKLPREFQGKRRKGDI
jgi:glucose-6-phosphate-specific signal transduction histidine kinase